MTTKYSNFNLNTALGDASEVLLMGELLLRGFSVSTPFGFDNPYDLVVEGRSGKLYKVQVKYKSKLRTKNTLQISDAAKYVGKIDVLAVLIIDTWYFFKEDFVKKYSNKLHLNINTKKAEGNNLKENFQIFC